MHHTLDPSPPVSIPPLSQHLLETCSAIDRRPRRCPRDSLALPLGIRGQSVSCVVGDTPPPLAGLIWNFSFSDSTP